MAGFPKKHPFHLDGYRAWKLGVVTSLQISRGVNGSARGFATVILKPTGRDSLPVTEVRRSL